MAMTDLVKQVKNGVTPMKRTPSVKDMERALGLDQCGVIYVNSADDLEDMANKGDAFAGWYEEELRSQYERHQNRPRQC